MSFFLAREGSRYLLLPERTDQVPKNQTPTFDEFKKGNWRNSPRTTVHCIGILPAGSELQLVDAIRRLHPETGVTISWQARIILPPNMSRYFPVTLAGLFEDDQNPTDMHGAERIKNGN
jgi:hypothetical protein